MRVLVTGANGLCGSAIRQESINSLHDFEFVGREYGDLTVEENVVEMYKCTQPDYVIHTAAKVGGIGGNEAQHGEFFYQNILINTYMIHYAKEFNVKKFLAFSSVCVFPDNLFPLQEDKMHEGPVFASNFSYGYAKRMVDVQIQAYKKQYGIRNFCSIIPGNIFGCNDFYHLEYGHVIPSLIHKLYLAKQNNTNLTVWGDGSSQREFIYVNDLAKILLQLLELDSLPDRLIISGPQLYSIREIVERLCNVANYDYLKVIWDTTKPGGQKTRPSDLSRLYSLLPPIKFTNIDKALEQSYDWFAENYPNRRIRI